MNRNVSWNLVPSSRTAWSAVNRNVSVHTVLGPGSNGQVLQNPSAPGPLALKWNAFPAADAAVAESATASTAQRVIVRRRMCASWAWAVPLEAPIREREGRTVAPGGMNVPRDLLSPAAAPGRQT